jgi:hypothetical protein
MYKLQSYEGQIVGVYKTEGDLTLCIPFDPANTDYQQFKADVLTGAELQDADGNVMTQKEADAFIATLP